MDLAPYAVRESRGRRHPERPHSYRSAFQRDRDRVIHTKAFRRLEAKTQVFDPEYSDHFRTRLTHTLEVTQVSRTLAEQLRLNVDLCEALALSHDIGHPPFSHEGEKVLHQIMSAYGEGFEHNLHALRIVEDFEERYAAFRGLNLTFEVREGIIKHSRDYEIDDEPYVNVSEYLPGRRPPLEAQLIDLGDEIAYNAADLDDGYDSGLLEVDQIADEVRLFRRLFEAASREFPNAEEKLLVSETIRSIINTLATNLIETTGRRIQREEIKTVDDVRAYPVRLVGFDDEMTRQNLELKNFLRRTLYDHETLCQGRIAVGRQIKELFNFYCEQPENLPESHAVRVGKLPLHRVVCDYIAGMTDTFALDTHARLSGPETP